jgi:hypothetical protein
MEKMQMKTDNHEHLKLIAMLGKLIPLGFIANEIDNDLEARGDGDSVKEIARCTDEKEIHVNYGVKIAQAHTINGRIYVTYFNDRLNQFRLYDMQYGTPNKKYSMPKCIHGWTVYIDDDNDIIDDVFSDNDSSRDCIEPATETVGQ